MNKGKPRLMMCTRRFEVDPVASLYLSVPIMMRSKLNLVIPVMFDVTARVKVTFKTGPGLIVCTV